MSRKYFGTDGVRGLANKSPMTADFAYKLGVATGKLYMRGSHKHRVVIGKDTRLSGYMFEAALVSGFISVGMDVMQLGPIPTPAIGILTKSLRADLGVMISASHNPYYDNGIKLFGPDGFKLSDDIELEIEALIDSNLTEHFAKADAIGRAKRYEDAQSRYIEITKSTFPKHLSLEGIKIVVDCAHGAAYRVAPSILFELGAEVIALNVAPNGLNINKECGSLHPQHLRHKVLEEGADIGIALDGDADRVIICDEKGNIIDGDALMAVIATYMHEKNMLKGNAVVTTIMSNMGFEKYIKNLDIDFIRTNVGDRYVVEKMRECGYNFGGEQSGHIVMLDYATTGDGLLAALQLLAVCLEKQKTVSEACKLFDIYPQTLKNIRFKDIIPLEKEEVKNAIIIAEQTLNGKGRIVIRKSGTEPLIRVMVEAENDNMMNSVADDLATIIEKCV